MIILYHVQYYNNIVVAILYHLEFRQLTVAGHHQWRQAVGTRVVVSPANQVYTNNMSVGRESGVAPYY